MLPGKPNQIGTSAFWIQLRALEIAIALPSGGEGRFKKSFIHLLLPPALWALLLPVNATGGGFGAALGAGCLSAIWRY